MKKIIPIIALIIFVIFCGQQVIAHVAGVIIDVLIGYYMLFLICNYIIKRKNLEDQNELFEKYEIKGIAKIVLASFKEIGQEIDKINKIIFNFLKKTKYSKRDVVKDTKSIMSYIIKVIEETGDNEICECVCYKSLFENSIHEPWNYYYHSRYIGNMLAYINFICIEKNLPLLGIIAKHSNGKISEKYINFCKREKYGDLEKFNIKQDMNVKEKGIQDYIKLIKQNLNEYKKIEEKDIVQIILKHDEKKKLTINNNN